MFHAIVVRHPKTTAGERQISRLHGIDSYDDSVFWPSGTRTTFWDSQWRDHDAPADASLERLWKLSVGIMISSYDLQDELKFS